jgi:hypothetical protein
LSIESLSEQALEFFNRFMAAASQSQERTCSPAVTAVRVLPGIARARESLAGCHTVLPGNKESVIPGSNLC